MERKMLSHARPVDLRNAVRVAFGLRVTACYVAQSLILAFALAARFHRAVGGEACHDRRIHDRGG